MALGAVYADSARHTELRSAGTLQQPTGMIFTIDSGATRQFIDTMSSDTLELLGTTEAIQIAYQMYGFTKCDSCNDSIIAITQLVTTMPHNQAPRVIFTDTFGTTGTIDSTEVVRKNFYPDTTFYTHLYVRTIVKDSVLEFSADEDQTLRLGFRIHIMERYRDE